ncbi:MetQ/NlpA family ABC transporter substrate-binding protein [Oscillibacter hominis]|uniref:Lipoprotein n=1 Tax=Oscillibacter hominis TaxID=2763056 RepID=A0A7G9B6Q1_9FIRM|nr:MetQ/NlpA family ABC transporter substrate-binding protein [Oscillibacter hominis]QNL45232.1 MetQ/NlpA family ABC transporter substrate-binding protein [Oscillibacter hominis]
MNKKVLSLILALALSLSLAACGSSGNGSASGSGSQSGSGSSSAETVVLKVAASPTPHAQILEQVKPVLAEQGIDLQITEYGDYVVPNTAVEEGDEDVNYFQHQPYLDEFNEGNGTHLVSVATIHYEPFGIYPGKTASLEDLPDGATVGVPSDVTNEARALQLLEAQGLIKLKEGAGLNATPNDIEENPKNLQFKELEAAMLPNVTSEVDIAVINGNYALQAGFSSAQDAIALEDSSSEAAQTFANVIVVKEGNENNAAVLALVEALKSDAVRDYINDTFQGNVLPIF